MVFQPGNNANPGGKPKGKEKQLRELLLPGLQEAVNVLLKALKKPDEQLKAAREILDRVYGKAPQSIEVSGKEMSPPIAIIIESSKK